MTPPQPVAGRNPCRPALLSLNRSPAENVRLGGSPLARAARRISGRLRPLDCALDCLGRADSKSNLNLLSRNQAHSSRVDAVRLLRLELSQMKLAAENVTNKL